MKITMEFDLDIYGEALDYQRVRDLGETYEFIDKWESQLRSWYKHDTGRELTFYEMRDVYFNIKEEVFGENN